MKMCWQCLTVNRDEELICIKCGADKFAAIVFPEDPEIIDTGDK